MLVQKLRLQRGWSQEQLAELSGLSVRTIQRIERGLPASTETLKSLASVFEIDFSTLQATQEPSMTTTVNTTNPGFTPPEPSKHNPNFTVAPLPSISGHLASDGLGHGCFVSRYERVW